MATHLLSRFRVIVIAASLIASVVAAKPALGVRREPFCPTAFTAGSVETLAEILTGFATIEQVRAFDKDRNGSLCWLHIPGVGYLLLDDATPR